MAHGRGEGAYTVRYLAYRKLKAYTHKLGSRGVENMVGEAGGGRAGARGAACVGGGGAPGGGGDGEDLYASRTGDRR